MEWATNGGLGTKIARPDRTVIVGCGDSIATAVPAEMPSRSR